MGVPVPEWKSASGEPLSHAIGRLGEREAAFFLGQEGWVVLYGPGGSQRFPRSGTRRVHQPTTKGLDLIAFNPKDGSVLILDNKAGRAAHAVDDVSAFTSRLRQKLQNRIGKLERGRAHLPPWAVKDMDRGIAALKQAEQALGGKGKWPETVRLAVSNAAGNASGISNDLARKLAGQGIHFIDMNVVKAVASPTSLRRGIIRAAAARFRREAAGAELKALEKLATRKVGGKAAARAGGEAMEMAVAKATGKALLRASAKAAARRTASLLPIIGWGFSARDAVAGVEDIMRGQTARGLAGISMAVGDVASDFLHIGDAVSGVGGTALSLGVQGGLIAGQLAVEMDRMKDKMDELQKEIRDRGGLPEERRLRDEFGLDDEAIAELKKGLAEQDTKPPTEDDLPPPPDWGQEEDLEWSEPPARSLPQGSRAPALPGRTAPLPPRPMSPPSDVPFWDQPIA
jgi:hypothetical protein